ncbi:hypothetical protein ABVT39_001476 [Epinephelus coioides]
MHQLANVPYIMYYQVPDNTLFTVKALEGLFWLQRDSDSDSIHQRATTALVLLGQARPSRAGLYQSRRLVRQRLKSRSSHRQSHPLISSERVLLPAQTQDPVITGETVYIKKKRNNPEPDDSGEQAMPRRSARQHEKSPIRFIVEETDSSATDSVSDTEYLLMSESDSSPDRDRTDELLQHICEQTNLYAEQYIVSHCDLPAQSRVHAWKAVDVKKLKQAFGLLFLTGTVQKPRNENYCHTDKENGFAGRNVWQGRVPHSAAATLLHCNTLGIHNTAAVGVHNNSTTQMKLSLTCQDATKASGYLGADWSLATPFSSTIGQSVSSSANSQTGYSDCFNVAPLVFILKNHITLKFEGKLEVSMHTLQPSDLHGSAPARQPYRPRRLNRLPPHGFSQHERRLDRSVAAVQRSPDRISSFILLSIPFKSSQRDGLTLQMVSDGLQKTTLALVAMQTVPGHHLKQFLVEVGPFPGNTFSGVKLNRKQVDDDDFHKVKDKLINGFCDNFTTRFGNLDEGVLKATATMFDLSNWPKSLTITGSFVEHCIHEQSI